MDRQNPANRLNYQPLWLQYFAEYLTNHGAAVKTRKNYCTDVGQVLTWVGLHRHMTEDFSLDDVSAVDLEAYKSEEARNGVPRTTINRRLSALRMFFCYAIEMALVRENPMKSVVNIPTKHHTIPIEVIAHPQAVSEPTSDAISATIETERFDVPYSTPQATYHAPQQDYFAPDARYSSPTLTPLSSTPPEHRGMPWAELGIALLIIGVLASWFFMRQAWDTPISTAPRASVAGISTLVIRENSVKTGSSDPNSPLATHFGAIEAPTLIPSDSPVATPPQMAEAASSFGLPTPTPTPSDASVGIPTETSGQDILSPLAESSTSGLIDREVTMTRSLNVLGDTLLTNTTITGGLTVGALLHFSGDGIDTYTNTFYIQKERFAGIDLGGGTLTIDTEGSVQIAGNLTVAGAATFTNTLGASTVVPYSRDLAIDLTRSASDSGHAAMTAGFGNFLVQGIASQSARFDASGSAYLSGNLTASGSATIAKLMISTAETGKATTGTTNIVTGLTEAFVLTTELAPTARLYITPLASTEHEVLYIKEKVPGRGFIVAIDAPISHDIPFNWWIVN